MKFLGLALCAIASLCAGSAGAMTNFSVTSTYTEQQIYDDEVWLPDGQPSMTFSVTAPTNISVEIYQPQAIEIDYTDPYTGNFEQHYGERNVQEFYGDGSTSVVTGFAKFGPPEYYEFLNANWTEAQWDPLYNAVDAYLWQPGPAFLLVDFSTYQPSALVTVTFADAVPEPAEWVLMLGGMFAIGATLRRRRASLETRPTKLALSQKR